MKVAIVHDYLHQFGGAERVVSVLHELFPQAPVYTSIFNKNNFPRTFSKMEVRTSFMQNIPFVFDNFRMFLPLYPLAFQSFDLREFDLVISSSSAFAHGIRKRKDAVHVCYCHNPMRFAWRYDEYIKKENWPDPIKKILALAVAPLKTWDKNASASVDYYIANSENVARRIKAIYNRESAMIYPPIETSRFTVSEKAGGYFLVASRLLAYKRIDLAVEAFGRMGLPLKIVGEGPAMEGLKRSASSNIEFIGRAAEEELTRLYSGCKALILPGVEDLGMAPLEAAASGRPTIAYAMGGALETIIEGKTGSFFNEQSPESIVKAVQKFDRMSFDRKALRFHSEMFDKAVFKKRVMDFLHENKIL